MVPAARCSSSLARRISSSDRLCSASRIAISASARPMAAMARCTDAFAAASWARNSAVSSWAMIASFSTKSPSLHADLGHAARKLGGDVDPLDLDAAVGNRQPGRHTARLMAAPVKVAAAGEGQGCSNGQGGGNAHRWSGGSVQVRAI